ncbi:MAG: outer membrane protein transport protein [Pseudomonadales bacterium]|nr:outer membrane protein transport protein [Pseudomonadales bacterium]
MIKHISMMGLLCVSQICYSQMLNNISIGNAKALGLAHAVTADDVSVDAIHFNPAALTRIKNSTQNFKLIFASVSLASEFGQPTQPTAETKQAYYNVNELCQDTYPLGGTSSQSEMTLAFNNCWGNDPIAGTRTESGDPVVLIPYSGVHETPLLGFVAGGAAFKKHESNITFATAAYVPEGIGFSRNPNESGAFQGQQVALTRITYLSPSFAIQLSEDFSFGMGINFSYQGVSVITDFRAPTLTLGFLRDLNNIEGDISLPEITFGPYDSAGTLSMEMEDGLSLGFNMGILWDVTPWLAVGIAYRSESVSELKGNFSMNNSDKFVHTTEGIKESALNSLVVALGGAPLNAQQRESGSVTLEYTVPQNASLGLSLRLLPDLKLNIDYKWADYSQWDAFEFVFSRNVDFLILGTMISGLAGYELSTPNSMIINRQYEDTYTWAFGVEYQVNDRWLTRLGYEPRSTAIPSKSTDLLFPIGDADLYTFGIGYRYDSDTTIDVGFGYMYSKSYTAACGSENANSCIEGNVVYNPYYATPFENEVNAYLMALTLDRKF